MDGYTLTKAELTQYLKDLEAVRLEGSTIGPLEQEYLAAYHIGRTRSGEYNALAARLEAIGCCFPTNGGKHEAVLYRCYILGKGEI